MSRKIAPFRGSFTRRDLLAASGSAALTVALASSLPARLLAADEIPVGALMPLSGAGGSFGERMLKSARAALEEINAAGGPLGRKIRLVEENTETNPEQAVRAAKKLVEVDKVVAILGTWASGVTLAVAPVAQQAKVIEMSTSGSSRITEIQKGGYVYRTEPDDVLFGKAYAEHGLRQGWKKASVLGLNVPFTETTVQAFRERFEEKGGEVLSFVTYNEEQTTFRSEVLKAFEGEPDFIHISGYEPDIGAILKVAYESGLKGRFLVPGFAVTDNLIKNAGAAAEGLLLVEEGVDEGSPGYKRVQEALGGDRYYSFAAQTYDQMQLLAIAIEAAGDPSGEAVNGKMRTISGPPGEQVTSFADAAKLLRAGKDVDYQGAAGPIDFNEDGNIATANFRVSMVKDGAITPTFELKDVLF